MRIFHLLFTSFYAFIDDRRRLRFSSASLAWSVFHPPIQPLLPLHHPFSVTIGRAAGRWLVYFSCDLFQHLFLIIDVRSEKKEWGMGKR